MSTIAVIVRVESSDQASLTSFSQAEFRGLATGENFGASLPLLFMADRLTAYHFSGSQAGALHFGRRRDAVPYGHCLTAHVSYPLLVKKLALDYASNEPLMVEFSFTGKVLNLDQAQGASEYKLADESGTAIGNLVERLATQYKADAVLRNGKLYVYNASSCSDVMSVTKLETFDSAGLRGRILFSDTDKIVAVYPALDLKFDAKSEEAASPADNKAALSKRWQDWNTSAAAKYGPLPQ